MVPATAEGAAADAGNQVAEPDWGAGARLAGEADEDEVGHLQRGGRAHLAEPGTGEGGSGAVGIRGGARAYSLAGTGAQ